MISSSMYTQVNRNFIIELYTDMKHNIGKVTFSHLQPLQLKDFYLIILTFHETTLFKVTFFLQIIL